VRPSAKADMARLCLPHQPDGEPDHVGIVESVANGVVNTIEGNASDSVMRRSYEIGSVKIYGYGVFG